MLRDYRVRLPQHDPLCPTPPDEFAAAGVEPTRDGSITFYDEDDTVKEIYAAGEWCQVTALPYGTPAIPEPSDSEPEV